MNPLKFRLMALGLACASVLGAAQNADQFPYMNPKLSAEQRAADLVRRMTLEEKAGQLVNQARGLPRLNVPAYDWWSEALHGVAAKGVTAFPEPIGLGATFDVPALHAMAEAIGTEARIKYQQALRANGGFTRIFQGLDLWAPNVNIFRDPRWGRGQETYGEDPFLSARLGVAFVTGLQGDDPHYYRAIATPKHFAVHSGPEATRHSANVTVSLHDERDTYLPAFRAAVTEGKAGSVMCAYNRVNGEPACASAFLLEDQLRGQWGFQGYVVSDCDAVRDIFASHHSQPSYAQAAAISLRRGVDNECADFFAKVTDNHDFQPYLDAVRQGFLKESEIDRAVVRLFTARMKLGLFDPPESAPFAKIDEAELESAAHRALALQLANESMVLLKNDGVLPLKQTGMKIAVVGPLAAQTRVLLGNYNGHPTHTVSILEGMQKQFPGSAIEFVPGTWFLNKEMRAVPASLLHAEGVAGVKANYTHQEMMALGASPPAATIVSRIESSLDTLAQPLPGNVVLGEPLSIHWETLLTADESGQFNLGVRVEGKVRVKVDGQAFLSFRSSAAETRAGLIHLEKGTSYKINVDYAPEPGAKPMAQLLWSKAEETTESAVTAARKADVVVAVVGIASELEGEEMDVNLPGFAKGDRTSLDLPEPEQKLLEALASTHKPLIVVLTNGSALSVNWAQQHANAILDAWYPGQEGGTAVAQTLSGQNNPAGRLPVTFYKSVAQLPPFEEYAMNERTYRYFSGAPLYPFGYGLSYTSFRYSGLKVPSSPIAAGDSVDVEATLTNTGLRAGDEVAQLYLSFPPLAGAPRLALRGFKRVHLAPGASTTVRFRLSARDLGMVTDAGVPMVAGGGYGVAVGGGQPGTKASLVKGSFRVKGTVTLPE